MIKLAMFAGACATVLAVVLSWLAGVLAGGSPDAGGPRSAPGVRGSGPGPTSTAVPEALRRLKLQRDQEILQSKQQLADVANQLVSSIDTLRTTMRAYRAEFRMWSRMDHGRIGAIGGTPPPAPQYPTSEVNRGVMTIGTTAMQYRNARQQYKLRVEQIRNNYYLKLKSVMKGGGANAKSNEPLSPLDPLIEKADGVLQQLGQRPGASMLVQGILN